jgi:WD40 repeat protein
MKNIKNNRMMRLIVLFMVIFMINTFAMRMSEAGKKSLKSYIQKVQPQLEQQKVAQEQELQQKRESMRKAGMYLIYGNDTDKGIMVDEKVINMSRSLTSMIADVGGEINEIPLNYPVAILKLGFGVLSGDVVINDLSEEELVNVANLFNFLDVSADKMNVVLMEIKEKIIDKNREAIVTNNEIKQLHPDLQKLLLTENTVDYLKDCIIKKYAKNRGKYLAGHPLTVTAVDFSLDGTKIVSGCAMNKNCLILWNISDLNNISHQVLAGSHIQDHIATVAFSPDGKKIVSGSWSQGAGLVLWDINDPNDITHQVLGGAADLIAFNPDGKSFISSRNRDINLWDITDPQNITSQVINPHKISYMRSIAFNPDGQSFISVNYREGLGLVNTSYIQLWKINNLNSKFDTILTPFKGENTFRLVAFHPDGKRFVSCGDEIILWDMSDLRNISSKVLVDNFANINISTRWAGESIYCLVFSHDGKTIALGHNNGFTLLNINDPSMFMSVNRFGEVLSLAFSPDDKQIVTGGHESGAKVGKNLNLWTLITDQEEMLLQQVKNYNADQIRLIYQLYFQFSKNQKVTLKKSSEEEAIFKTLPQDMQNLLNDLFSLKGWFSGWW